MITVLQPLEARRLEVASGSSAPTDSTSLTQRAALASSLEPHGSQKQTQSLTPHALREARRRRLLRREEERQVLSEAPPTAKIVLGGSRILIPTLAKPPPLSTHLPVAGATDQRRLRGHPAAPTRSPPPLPWHCGSLARGHWECAGLPQQQARRGGPGARPTDGSLGTREAGKDTRKPSPERRRRP